MPEPVIARVAEPEPAPAPTPAPTPAPAKSRTAFADLDRRPDARLDSLLGEEHRLRESPRSDDVEPVDDLFATSSRRAGGGSSYDGGKYRSGGSGAGPWLWLGGVALLGALAAAFWVFDPLGMTHRTIAGDGGEAELAENAAPVPVEPLGPEEEAVATGVWTTTDRDDPEALRGFLRTYPGSANADTARSLLRVMDAQAWANAVASDTESAYETYLATFPAGAPEPGAMTTAAKDRLASLGKERSRAVTDIQNGLKLAGLFDGAANGKVTDETRAAASAFARRSGVKAPDLASAAPRDLRAFGDAVRAAAEKSAGASTAAADTPVAAPAEAPAATPDVSAEAPVETSTASVAQPETTAPTAADAPLSLLPGAAPLTADEAADLERQAQAAAAAAAAQLQQENAAWLEAQRANTMAAYRAFIAQNPASAHVEDARGAIRRLGRSPAYGVDRMPETVRTAVTSARQAQSNATARAAAARTAAERAETVAAGPAASEITAPDGDLYRTETANSAPNGFGTRVSGKSVSAGDRYEGQLRNGLAQGLGVYTYGDNPNNAQAGALRYEGEHAGDQASGLGVTYWKNGDRFAGETRVNGEGQGVMNMTGGQRYEGQLRNGLRHGYGVVWGADGQAIEAGRFENGVLVEPVKVDAD
ncbi:MAG: hypothetical protein R3C52_10830 [Hyphomonadaceae bacterium]